MICWCFSSLRYKHNLVKVLPYWNIDSKMSLCTLGKEVMCLDMLWTTLLWKSHIVGEHCVWTRKFVVVFKGHRTAYNVHAKLLLKSVKTNQFYWMRYTIIGICYVWAKKVMAIGFSINDDWNGIQERLKKVPYQMKLEIKEVLRHLAFPETTTLSPPPRKLPTKGAKKKWTLRGLKEKLHRLVESFLRGRLLIPKIQIVNRHQELHHFLEKEVFVLVKHHFPDFHHLLGIQSLSLFRFQRLFRL